MEEGLEYNTMQSPSTEEHSNATSLDFSYDEDEPSTGTHLSIGNNALPKAPSPLSSPHDADPQAGAKCDDEYIPVTSHVFKFAMCAAMNSCNLGFDIGVNTSAGPLLQHEDSLDLSDLQLEILMGSLNMFAAVGAICASAISDRFGRRGGFVVAAIGFIFGVLVMTLSQSYAMLMFGRVFVGLGVGFGLAIDPIYIAEISPPSQRGRLVTWSEIATNVGIVLGFSSGLVFYKVEPDVAWRLMFGMGIIMPSCLMYLVWKVMPESPRWLVSKGREAEAFLVLSKVYPRGYDVEGVIKDIKESLEREIAAERAVGWDMIFFPSPAFKRMLLVGLGTAVAQQLVGIDAIQYFLMYIIEEAGIDERVWQSILLIALGILKLVVIVCAGSLFDTRGRRPLFFASLIGMAISLVIIGMTFFVDDANPSFAIVGLATYLAFFSFGMGPGAWLIPSEVFSTAIRAKAMSMATFLNRVTATFVTSTFLTAANVLTWGGFFFLLAFICLAICLFFQKYLPETKGRSLEDMSLYFAKITGDTSLLEAEARLRGSSQERENGAEEEREII